MVVPAPGLLSITTGCPSRGESFSPTARATMSTPPPGGNGTMKRTGRAGYVCDQARPLAVRSRKAASSLRIRALCGGGGGTPSGFANARRPLVHQPLQREGGDADRDQRAPGEVVVAEAVEHQAAHPGAEERADLVAEEHHAEQRIEMRQAENARDDAVDQRGDAEPEENHRGSENESRSGADRRDDEEDDEQRAQQINEREQVLLAVAGAELAEGVGADGVEQADQAERGGAEPRGYAAKGEVRRQVGGEEYQLEAAGEEGERHEQIAAVADRLAQGVVQFGLRPGTFLWNLFYRQRQQRHGGAERSEHHHRHLPARGVDEPAAERREHHRAERPARGDQTHGLAALLGGGAAVDRAVERAEARRAEAEQEAGEHQGAREAVRVHHQ